MVKADLEHRAKAIQGANLPRDNKSQMVGMVGRSFQIPRVQKFDAV